MLLTRLLLVSLILAGFALRLHYLTTTHPFYDEYTTVLAARQILRHGWPLLPSGLFYEHGLLATYLAAPFTALFIDAPYNLWQPAHWRLMPARWPSLLVSVATIPLIFTVARRLLTDAPPGPLGAPGPAVGLLAAGLFALSPEGMVWGARARMYALATLLVLLTVYWGYRGARWPAPARYRWLALAALLAALLTQFGVMMLIPPLLLAMLGLGLWSARCAAARPWFLRPAILAEGTALAAVIIVAMLVKRLGRPLGMPGLAAGDSSLPTELLSAVAYQVTWYATWADTERFLARQFGVPHHFWLAALTGLGLLLAVALPLLRRRRTPAPLPLSPGILFTLTIFGLLLLQMLTLLEPFRRNPRYLVMYLPLFYLVAAAVLLYLAALPLSWSGRLASPVAAAGPLAALGGVLLYTAFGWPSLRVALLTPEPAYEEALAHIQADWQPGDVLLTMNTPAAALYLGQVDAFTAQHDAQQFLLDTPAGPVDRWLGAPWLGDAATFAAALNQNERVWFVIDTIRLPVYFRGDWQALLNSQMEQVWQIDEALVYRSRDNRTPLPTAPAIATTATLGQNIDLLGYTLDASKLQTQNSELSLTLFWQPRRVPAADYTVFIHLRDAAGQTVVQADGQPLAGVYPTGQWQPGETVIDRHTLPLPPDLPPGRYTLWAGLYRLDTLERLPVANDASGENAVRLGEVEFTVNLTRLPATRWLASRRLLLALFGLALLPRLPGLGLFLTTDESYFIHAAGSDVVAAFLQGDWRGTYWHFYPGVTMSWLDAVGLAGQYLLQGRPQPFLEYIYSDILALIVAVRLPYALLTALFVPLFYGLARRLLPLPVALLGALLLAFDPFFLAHSRVAHGDAPVTVFMVLSALAFFVMVSATPSQPPPARGRSQNLTALLKNPYLWLSAVCGGLAALTKAPGQFMALFVVGFSLLYAFLDWWAASELRITNALRGGHRSKRRGKRGELPPPPPGLRRFFHWLTVVAIWGFISLITFILLWPAMWVDPLGTFSQMLDETFGKVNEGHLVYFMGQPMLDPGPWFYSYVIPFRLTPPALLGAVLSLLLFVPSLRRRVGLPLQPLALLWLFVISLLLFGNLSPKKQDRYLLPLFPFLDLLAAIGWVGVFSLAVAPFQRPQKNENKRGHPPGPPAYRRLLLPALLLVVLHAVPVISYYPYYLTYFNPLLGGPTRAAETTLMGWGEGMEQVAAYLNTKPNAEQLYVASTPSQTLLPYFAGRGENFYTNDIALRADYVVLYVAQMQRLAPSPEIVNYFLAQSPEKTITIHGVEYAKIYPNQPRILTEMPPWATPQNIGLGDKMRLAGYVIGQQSLSLTLYWHVLAPLSENYTISVRAYNAAGEQLAQQDQWPVDGLLATRHLRLGDYVADTHLLTFAPADTPHLATYEVVVYNADTGQTLGSPILIER